MAPWSARRVVLTAVGILCLSVLPLVGVVAIRLHQIRTARVAWARTAEASRWLSLSAICGGAQSPDMARADLERWRHALEMLATAPSRAGQTGRSERLVAFSAEVDAALRRPAADAVTWVAARCGDAQRLADAVLQQAIAAGGDIRSREDRYEDLAVRDLTAFVLGWSVLALAVAVWAGRAASRPVQRLARVVARVAQGDLDATLPSPPPGAMRELSGALESLLVRQASRDTLRSRRLVEMRNLARRLIDMVEQPALVVSLDRRIEYANSAAGRALDEAAQGLEGRALADLPGGEVLAALVHDILRTGEVRGEGELPGDEELRRRAHLVRCAVVHDGTGIATRVIMIFEDQLGAWWRKLWG